MMNANDPNYDVFQHMTQVCAGKWDVVASRYNILAEAASRYPRQTPCPITGKGKTKFRFQRGWEDSGLGYHNDRGPLSILQVVSEVEGINKGEAAELIIKLCGGINVDFDPKKVEAIRNKTFKLSKEDVAKRSQSIKKILQGCMLASESDIAKRYFKTRTGMDYSVIPDHLLFHPSLSYYEYDNSKKKAVYAGKHPALVCKFVDVEGKGITLHRIYLQEHKDGSVTKLEQESKVDAGQMIDPKKVMSPPRDMSKGNVRLFGKDGITESPIGGYVGSFTEGVETGMAILNGTGLSTFACYSSTILVNQEVERMVEKGVTFVVIWGDKDANFEGQEKAFKLARKFRRKGIEAYVLLPSLPITGKGVDWEDELKAYGPERLLEMMSNPVTLDEAKAEHERFVQGGGVS